MRNRELKSQNWQKGFAQKGFFRSFWHNATKVLTCNALLFGVNILSFLVGICIVFLVAPMISSVFTLDGLKTFILENELASVESVTDDAVASIFYLISLLFSMLLTGSLLIVNGPFHAAVSYYFKNLLAGDASFKTDFKQGLKDNWKKSLGASFLSILITFVVLFNIGYYSSSSGILAMAAKCFFLTVLVFWAAMQLYVYPLIACVELKFREVYRNAATMTLKNFPVCFGVVIFELVIFGVIPFTLITLFSSNGYAITMLLYLVFSFGFTNFISVYMTWKAIQKIVQEDN